LKQTNKQRQKLSAYKVIHLVESNKQGQKLSACTVIRLVEINKQRNKQSQKLSAYKVIVYYQYFFNITLLSVRNELQLVGHRVQSSERHPCYLNSYGSVHENWFQVPQDIQRRA